MSTLNLAFASLLKQDNTSLFELDLRDKPLLFVANKMIETKSKMHKDYSKQYSALLSHLEKIESTYGHQLKTEHITDIFWCAWMEYLQNLKLANSTMKKLSGQLKHIVEWGGKHNAKVSTTYDEFSIPDDDKYKVVLSPSDVARIYYFDLDNKKMRSHHRENLKRVRDMIVLSCNLGQRFSDMSRITPDCFERNIFKIVQKKTNHKAIVDIDRFAMDRKMVYEILERYGYNAPFSNDISQYNKFVKELMELVGLDEKIRVERKEDGEMKVEQIEKWKKISSHTARRSFATYNYIRNLPKREIMRATGHKTEESFNEYIIYND